jgi:diguanylate cyclase (GGDEF)-like protein
LAIVALGGAAVVLDVVSARLDRPVLFVELLALAIATSAVKVSVPLSRGRSSLSLSFAVTLAAIPLLGGTEACFIGMGSAWTQCTFRMKARNPLHRTLFSIAMVGVSVHAALLLFGWAHADDEQYMLSLVRPMLSATAGYFVVNSLLVAAAIALATHQAILRVWRDNFLWSAPTYFIAGSVAVLSVIAAETGRYGWAMVLVVPLYLTYRSSRTFVDRLEREEAQVRHVSEVQLATIEALALAIEIKDQTSLDHVQQIQRYAEGLARAVGVPENEIPGIKTAALLHDIGHLAVPEHILVKPGPLTHDEFQRVKIHPRVGADIIGSVPFPYPVAPLILSHHERWDGAGYPSGLRGEEIPLGARVLAVVDCFTALRADRPYRPAKDYQEALTLLQQQAGAALDPALVREFLAILPDLERHLTSAAQPPAATGEAGLALAQTGGGALEDIMTAHREAQVLYEIAEELGRHLSVEGALSLLASKLPHVVPFSSGALFLWDTEAGCFRCRCATGAGEEYVRRLTARDVSELTQQLPTSEDEVALRSSLTSALLSGGQAIGVLAIYCMEPEAYTDDHRRLLDRVSRQAASVIANALVFEQMHEASLTDTLTGLANRRALYQEMQRNIARAEREKSRVSVLLLDVNELKQINDTHGHHVGDAALQHVGATLSSMRRGSDISVRFGGDEFVVVLWSCGAVQAEARRRELQRAIGEKKLVVGQDLAIGLSVSAGAATFPEDGASADALLAIADQRMYVDKALRRSSAAGATLNRPDAPLPLAV